MKALDMEGGGVSATLRPLYPPLYKKQNGPPGPVWTLKVIIKEDKMTVIVHITSHTLLHIAHETAICRNSPIRDFIRDRKKVYRSLKCRVFTKVKGEQIFMVTKF